jgi:hypothetical protein
MAIDTTEELKVRLIYADACQSSIAIQALVADAEGKEKEYFRLMELVGGLHWRISSLRCLTLSGGSLTISSCLNDEAFNKLIQWIDEVCGSECCSCSDSMEDKVPAILL